MSETRQLILFFLCVGAMLCSVYGMSETVRTRVAVERMSQKIAGDK